MSEGLRARWKALMDRDRDYFVEIANGGDTRTDMRAGMAIDLRAYDYDAPIAAAHGRLAVESLERALRTERVHETRSPREDTATGRERAWLVAQRKAPLVRGLAFAHVASTGEWDLDLIREARDAYEDAVANAPSRNLSMPDQWRLHAAVLLALVAQDFAKAHEILRKRKPLKDTRPFHERLAQIVSGLVGETGTDAETARRTIDEIFEVFRQPEVDTANRTFGVNVINGADIYAHRFTFALLRDRHVLGHGGTPDWRRVFGSIPG